MPIHATLGLDGKVPSDQLPAGGPGGPTAWADIADKPSTFPPATHDHDASYDPIGVAAAAYAAAVSESLPLHGKADTAGAADTAAALSTGADRTKLDGISAGATVGADWNTNVTNKPTLGTAAAQDTTAFETAGAAAAAQAAAIAADSWQCGQTTYNLTTASGVQNIAHGLGRVPKFVRITAQLVFSAAVSMECVGRMCSSAQSGQCIIWTEGTSTATTDNIYQSTAAALGLSNAGGTNPFSGSTKASGVITVDATNIIITWTKTGSPTGTANLAWECT